MRPLNESERAYSYTLQAWQNIKEAVSSEMFFSADDTMTCSILLHNINEIPFQKYLKRYLYKKAGILKPFSSVPTEVYEEIMVDAFHQSGTPCSFTACTTRLSQAVRNWLTRDEASRSSILLMGFGLYMSVEDINEFLVKANHDSVLDADDPQEAICLYCYRHSYRYAKYQQLWKLYQKMDNRLDVRLIEENQPPGRQESRLIIQQDVELLTRLMERKNFLGPTSIQCHAFDTYQKLYNDTQKQIQSVSVRKGSPRSIERILSAAIPLDSNGNLIPAQKAFSSLKFAQKRISRQRIHRILTRVQRPNRYDLLTLQFFLLSEQLMDMDDRQKALRKFLDTAGGMLTDCGYGEIYAADPFDAFLILCMLTCDPLGTYSDVMETAYTMNGLFEDEKDI